MTAMTAALAATQGIPAELPAPLRRRLAERGRCLRTHWTDAASGAHGHIAWRHWLPEAPGAHAAALVLLHGGSGSWTHWVRNIAALLDAGRSVWAADLPGFGDSDPPNGSDADAMAEPLAQGLRQLFGAQPVDLVGFSFGGVAAGLLLAAHPALAQRLVLVGAPGMGVPAGRSHTLKGWRHLPQALHDGIHRHNLAELMLHRPQRIDALALALHRANVARDRLPRRRLSRTPILAQTLPRVPCPVFAICGEHDVLFAPNFGALGQALQNAAPQFGGLQLVADAGHWVQYEQPEAFHAALLRALADPPVVQKP